MYEQDTEAYLDGGTISNSKKNISGLKPLGLFSARPENKCFRKKPVTDYS